MLNLKWTEAQENENTSNHLLTWKIVKDACWIIGTTDRIGRMPFFTGTHLHSSLWYPALVSHAADSGIVLESFSNGTLSSCLSFLLAFSFTVLYLLCLTFLLFFLSSLIFSRPLSVHTGDSSRHTLL